MKGLTVLIVCYVATNLRLIVSFRVLSNQRCFMRCSTAVASVSEDDARRELLSLVNDGVSFNGSKKRKHQTDPLMGYSLQDLEAYAASQSSQSQSPLLSSNTSPDDALFLDPDVYLQSSERLNPDGSLPQASGTDTSRLDTEMSDELNPSIDPLYREAVTNFLETIPTPVLDTSGDNSLENPTMDDLWNVIRQRGTNPLDSFDLSASEALHQQVFANEDGFRQNSAAFLESLTDATKIDEAVVERRGRAYRERQEQALASLEAQMSEFMATLEQTKAEDTNERCRQCRALLSEAELQAPTQAKETNATTGTRGLLCSVCYKDVLVAQSRQADQDRRDDQEQRGQSVMRSFRQTGVVSRPDGTPRRQYWTSRDRPALDKLNTNRMSAEPRAGATAKQHTQSTANSPPATVRTASSPDRPLPQKPVVADFTGDGTVAARPVSNVPTPWVKVIDPDTQEVFYWNEQTEEMRWDL